jgi:colanic acid/amylovoran biosynthesis glycosyltransferase
MDLEKYSLAIYSSNNFQETFTRAHRDLIPFKYVLSEGTPPRMVNGIPMLPLDKWNVLKRKVNAVFGKKIRPNDPLEYFLSHTKVDLFVAEFGMGGAAVVPLCKKYKVPLIVNFYGIDAFGKDILTKYRSEYRLMFEYGSLFSVQSESIKQQLIKMGCDRGKITVNSCPPADDFSRAKAPLDALTLISVGRFVEKKSPLQVIRSFALVKNAIPESRLIMIGDGPLLEPSEKLALDLGIKEAIEFKGRQTPAEQLKLMQEASVFVQHSVVAADGDSEGLPVAIMEASAMGLPVVSTFHSGIPEAVEHEVTGFLVKEGAYEEMAKYCVQLLKEKELRLRMGEAGKQKMRENFTMDLHIGKMKDFILKILKN